jgi:WD40 repeat protein
LLAAGNSDMTARIWDTATGREAVRFHGDKLGQVHQIALSPDGETLATLDMDQGVRLWDARTGKHLRQVKGSEKEQRLGTPCIFTFSPDSRTLYTGLPGSVTAIAVADGKEVALPDPPERGLSIDAVAPDGEAAVSFAKGERLVVWDLRSGKALSEVSGPRNRDQIALSSGAKRLAVATKETEPTVVVWDLKSGKELCRCKGHRAWVSSLAFAPDGKTLATGSGDLTARLWDAESGKERWAYRADGANFYWVAVAFGPDGKTVGVAGWEGNVRFLDAATGKERVPLPGHLQEIGPLAITPDGKAVFTSGNDQSLRLWDIATGKELRILKAPAVNTYDPEKRKVVHPDGWIYSLHLTPDGKSLAVGQFRCARIWDVSDPDRPRPGDLVDDSSQIALAPDGKSLATVGRKLKLLDVRTRKLLSETEIEDGRNLCFSPDGRTLAVGGAKEVVRLYDVRTWRERAVLRGGGAQAVERMVFSPDGQLLVSSGMDWRIDVWEVASGHLRRRIDRKESMMDALAFSPDGRYLAIGGMSGAISIRDVASDRVIHTFRGHDKDVVSLAFTPDGRRLISGGRDTTALVWDVHALPAPEPREVKRTTMGLGLLWQHLAGDAEKADAAMREMAASQPQAVALIARSLKPVEKEDAQRVARMVRDLGSESFAEREQASADLEKVGEEAVEALQGALGEKPSPEVRHRAGELLDRLKAKGPSPERLRALRAVQVLEWIGTPEARRALEAVADGVPDAERTRAAAAALACLKKRY